MYGLLGVVYEPENTHFLHVYIPQDNEILDVVFAGTKLGSRSAYIGLPEEYSSCMLNYITKLAETKDLKLQGRLKFNYAAHCLVGSYPLMFAKLTSFLLTLISLNKSFVTKEFVQAVMY